MFRWHYAALQGDKGDVRVIELYTSEEGDEVLGWCEASPVGSTKSELLTVLRMMETDVALGPIYSEAALGQPSTAGDGWIQNALSL